MVVHFFHIGALLQVAIDFRLLDVVSAIDPPLLQEDDPSVVAQVQCGRHDAANADHVVADLDVPVEITEAEQVVHQDQVEELVSLLEGVVEGNFEGLLYS